MKRWFYQFGIGALFIVSLVVITIMLRTTFLASANDYVLVSSLYNLYLVPILIAAMVLDETGVVVIALLAIVSSSIARYGFHWPTDSMALGALGVRGAFFVTLGYIASSISSRMRANTRSWQSLLDISRSINSSLDPEETLQTITRESVELTSADACAIRLLSDDGNELVFAKSWGLSERYITKGPLRIHENPLAQRVMQGGETIMRNVRKVPDVQYNNEMMEEGIVSILTVPLRIGEQVTGLLNLYRKRAIRFSSRDLRVAHAFAEQASIAIQNARLYDSIRRNYLNTVRALTRAIEAKDSFTLGHSERVAEYAVSMGRELELSATEMQTLEFGALLHDLGKISLDEKVLAKTSQLSVDERVMMEMHPMIGKSILEPVEFLRPAIPIVLHHHERWDGTGYPEGLIGEETPLLARIVGVASGFDHILYHSSPFPVPEECAIEDMRREAGSCYDPHLVAVLTEVIHRCHARSNTNLTADQPSV